MSLRALHRVASPFLIATTWACVPGGGGGGGGNFGGDTGVDGSPTEHAAGLGVDQLAFIRDCAVWVAIEEQGSIVEAEVINHPDGHCITSVQHLEGRRFIVALVEGEGGYTTGSAYVAVVDGEEVVWIESAAGGVEADVDWIEVHVSVTDADPVQDLAYVYATQLADASGVTDWISVWDISTASPISTVMGVAGAFSADGSTAAIAAADCRACTPTIYVHPNTRHHHISGDDWSVVVEFLGSSFTFDSGNNDTLALAYPSYEDPESGFIQVMTIYSTPIGQEARTANSFGTVAWGANGIYFSGGGEIGRITPVVGRTWTTLLREASNVELLR